MRELGDFFRKRYTNKFISSTFNIKEILITSSHSDRALTSAQAFSNGLYPPTSDNDYFDLNVQWQPIPIHTVGEEKNDPVSFFLSSFLNLNFLNNLYYQC